MAGGVGVEGMVLVVVELPVGVVLVVVVVTGSAPVVVVVVGSVLPVVVVVEGVSPVWARTGLRPLSRMKAVHTNEERQ